MVAKGYRQAKAFIGEGRFNEWAAMVLKLSWQNAKVLVVLITGYAKMNYHRYRTGSANPSDYTFWWFQTGATRHILCDCEALVNE